MLTVSAKAIGQKKPIVADFSIPVPDGITTGRPVLLRDVIEHVVRAEVAAFRDRQAERRLFRALTAKQIEEGLSAGKVSAGGSDLDQAVGELAIEEIVGEHRAQIAVLLVDLTRVFGIGRRGDELGRQFVVEIGNGEGLGHAAIRPARAAKEGERRARRARGNRVL